MPGFRNPFRPGAGQPPPHLAGRSEETEDFKKLLEQDTILENLVLTGLRGVGKTVLLDTFKPIAETHNWIWVGTDLSESASVNEEAIATRLLADLAIVTSGVVIREDVIQDGIGFGAGSTTLTKRLDYQALRAVFDRTPGLIADKLKSVLELAWKGLADQSRTRGIIFAYDEAQILSDRAEKEQFPLSLMLDVFQSLQRRGFPLMLVLTGLPALFPKLVEARTYSERMFHVIFLDSLNPNESKDAILKPIDDADCPIQLDDVSVNTIVTMSGGYPYFIQFICREVYDVFMRKIDSGERPSVPIFEIEQKLDNDFFAGRWARATDRQREMMCVIARLDNHDREFTVQEIVDMSKQILIKPFSPSHANQMLSTLSDNGLIFKNRHGKYSFAVPLMGKFIQRQQEAVELMNAEY